MNKTNMWFFKKRFFLILFLTFGASTYAYSSGSQDQKNEASSQNEERKGPNGGKLLSVGNIDLELKIFESGIPPEYRAWVSKDGDTANGAEINVTLTRLDGQQDKFAFKKENDYWRGIGLVSEPHSFDVDVSLRLDAKTHHWQWESHEGRVVITESMAKNVGITTEKAEPRNIERHLQVFGRLVTPPHRKSELRARFPGVVTDVQVNVGDSVDRGDRLATIESNQSLQKYDLRSPIAGVVQGRFVNVGELAEDSTLFSIVDDETLWAELKIFPTHRAQVQRGQTVHIFHNEHKHEGLISHVTSLMDGSPYVLAKVELHNKSGELSPGDLVTGRIDVEIIENSLAVDKRALQEFRDWTVVFIKVGETYEIRPLELGISDESHTQVLGGLNAGDFYVVENSYLIKADIEKSGASHDH